MDRDILIHLPAVLAVARSRSFAAAAKELSMSPSAVSHAVRSVEDRLGLPLFTRTTRSVSLTETGRDFVAATAPAASDIADAVDRARAANGQVTGLLRLNIPSPTIALCIDRVVREMTNRYPDLRIEVYCENSNVDIFADGFDAGVRLGGMIAEDMVAIRLTPPFRTALVAAPSYLQRHGTPVRVSDLQDHNCITYRKSKSETLFDWYLKDGGEEVSIEVKGSIVVNDVSYARQLALDGFGIVYVYEPLLREEIADGHLVEILQDSVMEKPGFFLYFPQRASRSPKLRAFIDTAKDVLKL